MGNRTTSWINGIRIVDFHDDNPQVFEGGFALQLHAGGADGIISRADAKALVNSLFEDGKGTEMMVAEELFGMIDAHDSARGARVTEYDLNASRPIIEMWLDGGNGLGSGHPRPGRHPRGSCPTGVGRARIVPLLP